MSEAAGKLGVDSLFRGEAAQHRSDTWLGEILLVQPVPFVVLSGLAFTLATVLVLFLVFGEYTKKARVVGYVVPEQGLIKVHTQQPGIVAELFVHEGELVTRGQVVAVVSAERSSARGETQSGIAAQLEARRASLLGEKKNVRELYRSLTDSASTRLTRIEGEIGQLDRALEAQRMRVRIAQTALDRSARLLQEKFISESALQDKQADLIDQQNHAGEFERNRSALERDRASIRSELAGYAMKSDNELRALDRSIAELEASALENEARREGFVVAPEAGVVTALQVDRGTQVAPAAPLMSLIPKDARLKVDLYVPSRSIGFVRLGGLANLQYQPFPFQKFGTHLGKVVKASRTSVAATELPFPVPSAEAYYIVTVAPEHDHVMAYGRKEPLKVGMQVDADLWLDRRSLLEWVLEPALGIAGRV